MSSTRRQRAVMARDSEWERVVSAAQAAYGDFPVYRAACSDA